MNDEWGGISAGLQLDLLDHFPDELLDVPATALWRHLRGPSLFHIPGRQTNPLFVTVLLHGNEHTGWQAMQQVLRHHNGRSLQRSLMLFVANIEAAKANVRTLPGQTDYNRTWPGTLDSKAAETSLMTRVFDIVRMQAPFASIDIHNNTGNNPHYVCVTSLDDKYLHLARLFSRTVVYFEKPIGVQSAALAAICPAVTVECGRIGDDASANHASEFVSAALALSHFPDVPLPEADIDLMRTYAIIKVPPDASFSFDGADADLQFRPDLDHLNFSDLAPGTSFGVVGAGSNKKLEIVSATDHEGVDDYFDYTGGHIRLSQGAVPAMLTQDPQAVRLDCLGYLMHRIGRDGRRIE
jgi:succinylglutamate desuccinylase